VIGPVEIGNVVGEAVGAGMVISQELGAINPFNEYIWRHPKG
jgi:hypothetical protein